MARKFTEPLDGCLQAAFHPFTRDELERVRARLVAKFPTVTGGPSVNANPDPLPWMVVMRDLVCLSKVYRSVGDPIRYWIHNIEAELVQRERPVPMGASGSDRCHDILREALASGLNVLAEITGPSAEASRNRVVDPVQMLAYNKARTANRTAIKRSETLLKKWTDAHGEAQDAADRRLHERDVGEAAQACSAATATLAQCRILQRVVESCHSNCDSHDRSGRFSRADIDRMRSQSTSATGLKLQLTNEHARAIRLKKRVQASVDDVKQNQAWLANEIATTESECNKLKTHSKRLEDKGLAASVLPCHSTWLSVTRNLRELRQLYARGLSRLQQVSKMSNEDNSYENLLTNAMAMCDGEIALTERDSRSVDDGDGEVIFMSEESWEQRDQRARAAVVELD